MKWIKSLFGISNACNKKHPISKGVRCNRKKGHDKYHICKLPYGQTYYTYHIWHEKGKAYQPLTLRGNEKLKLPKESPD